jgi:hypothetical protein
MNASGGFVVAWINGTDIGASIRARLFNAAGIPQGDDFIVSISSTISSTNNTAPNLVMNTDGDFVVAWHGYGPFPDTDQNIFARRYNAAGVAQGDAFVVNTVTAGIQESPSAAIDATGNFVIVWQSPGAIPIFTEIHARRFDAAGVGAPQFNVTTSNSTIDAEPSVAMDSAGNFVVAFQRGELFARRFTSAGVGGAIFPVNTFTTGIQHDPEVAIDPDGKFLVTWTDNARDGSGHGVYARRFSPAAAPVGSEFRVNTFTSGDQNTSALAATPDGNFVAAWRSAVQDPGGSAGVYAQLLVSAFPAPTVADSAFLFDAAPHRLRFTFNSDVSASLGLDDIVLENLTTSATIPSSDLSVAYDTNTNTATFSYTGNGGGFSGVLPDGNYRATLLAAGITFGGVPLAQNHVLDFFFLNGDANHDAKVDVADLGILASNWQRAPRTFAQGDFDYGGGVDVNDLGILASHWQQQLSAPAASRSRAAPSASRRPSRLLDQLGELSCD